MGKPKFSRKKYETPSHPWQEDRIKAENEIVKKYGLKNKREVWKAGTSLKKYRGQARTLLAKVGTDDPQAKKEANQLLAHLTRYNILPLNSTLDDVLALQNEAALSRRLQTITYLKGLANTPTHARQLISHGHIAVDGRKVTVPGYMVTKDEENKIGYTSASPLNDLMHPARPRADFKSAAHAKVEPKKTEDVIEPELQSKKQESKEPSDEKQHAGTLQKEEKPAEETTEEKPAEQPIEEKTEKVETDEKPPVEETANEEKPVSEPESINESPNQEDKPAEGQKEEKIEEPSKDTDDQNNKNGGN